MDFVCLALCVALLLGSVGLVRALDRLGRSEE
jgi:hypothetical protein